MSMMMRRNAMFQGQHRDPSGLDRGGDPRFPEVAGATATSVAAFELRPRIEGLLGQQFSGYLQIGPVTRGLGPQGTIFCHEGRPIDARTSATEGATALAQLLAPDSESEMLYAAHALTEGTLLALAATFFAPQLTQPMGGDGGEVAVLLRDLAAVRHSGAVEISATGTRSPEPIWVRILMYDGKFLGVYSAGDRVLKASLADVAIVLAEATPQMTLFVIHEIPAALALPPRAASASARGGAMPGATPERDEQLENDLVWFMSRFERAFGRLKDRRDPQSDLLRAFGELTNELASFVATLQAGTTAAIATHGIVAAELTRARAAGIVTVDFKLGKAGLDAPAIAKAYGGFPKRGPAAAAFFAAASAGMLTVIDRLMERMIGAFYDPAASDAAREGCETLLREIRAGLAGLGHL